MSSDKQILTDQIFELISRNSGKNWENIFPDVLKDLESYELPRSSYSSEYKDIIGSFPMHNDIPIVFCKQCNKPILVNYIKQHETLCIAKLSTKTLNVAKINELQVNTVVRSNEYITMTDDQIDKKRDEIKNAFNLTVHINEKDPSNSLLVSTEKQNTQEEENEQIPRPYPFPIHRVRVQHVSVIDHKTKRLTPYVQGQSR